ncbi:hypothetical protein V8073_004529 [Vibrio parahaemolyticus]|nr:hypothetical protein [Vibrio vulnificus]
MNYINTFKNGFIQEHKNKSIIDYLSSNISKRDYEIFYNIAYLLDYNNDGFCSCSFSDIPFLDIDAANLNRSLKKLDKAGFITFENKTVTIL